MIVLLSPSKTLNYDDDYKVSSTTTPALLSQTKELLKDLKKMKAKDIQKLMSVSPSLSELNYERYQSFPASGKGKGSRAALLAFRGDVYDGFELDDYTKRDYDFSQKTIRILSGLYGYIKPLDLIHPYRLEMGTKLKTKRGKNLYDFWNSKITDELNKDLKKTKSKEVINLASVEYAKSLNFKDLNADVVNVDFKVKKDGALKTIGLFAKKARGMMANYIVQNRLKDSKDLKSFKVGGYRFQSKLSDSHKLVFVKSA